MKKPGPKRLLLIASAVALTGAIGFFAWKLWHDGGAEGAKAWKDGRLVALSITTGRAEGGYVPPPPEKKPEAAPEVPPETSPEASIPPSEPEPEQPAEEPPAAPEPADEHASAPQPEAKPAEAAPAQQPAPVAELAADGALAAAPAADLSEKTAAGTLPIISKSGQKPWQAYARPFQRKGKMPLIAVILTGLGQNRAVTEAAIALPPEVSLSFSPYARDVGIWIAAARARGHEAWLDLPMEPEGFPANDPGPLAQLSTIEAEENTKRLHQVMGKGAGAVGLVAPVNEVFSGNAASGKSLSEQVAARGLVLAAARPGETAPLARLLGGGSLPFLQADQNLDAQMEAVYVAGQLTDGEALATKRGTALIVGRATPLNLKEISKWLDGLSGRGFQLAPASALARMRFS